MRRGWTVKSKTSVVPTVLNPSFPPSTSSLDSSSKATAQAPLRTPMDGPAPQRMHAERYIMGRRLTKLVAVTMVFILPVSNSTAPGCCFLLLATLSSPSSSSFLSSVTAALFRFPALPLGSAATARAAERRLSRASMATKSWSSSSDFAPSPSRSMIPKKRRVGTRRTTFRRTSSVFTGTSDGGATPAGSSSTITGLSGTTNSLSPEATMATSSPMPRSYFCALWRASVRGRGAQPRPWRREWPRSGEH
mmetsp:Transcript_71385/g.204800  ORF Transcript_71385/g.204800 Transcript_71385/m.204800 type:complete len:249 (+) Transcript_71385:922-1668(+)